MELFITTVVKTSDPTFIRLNSQWGLCFYCAAVAELHGTEVFHNWADTLTVAQTFVYAHQPLDVMASRDGLGKYVHSLTSCQVYRFRLGTLAAMGLSERIIIISSLSKVFVLWTQFLLRNNKGKQMWLTGSQIVANVFLVVRSRTESIRILVYFTSAEMPQGAWLYFSLQSHQEKMMCIKFV
jgi:hypothetical protein